MKLPKGTKTWKSAAAKLLIGTLTLPISLFDPAMATQTALAAEHAIVLSELEPSNNGFVEIWNSGSASVNLDSWSVWSVSHGELTTLNGTLAPNEFRVVETNDLRDSGDTVSLRTSSGTIEQRIEYGDTATAHVPAPSHGYSLGRTLGSGTIVSNTAPTPGSSNQSPLVLSPSPASIHQTTENPANTINEATERTVAVRSMIPAGATQLTTLLIDQDGRTERETTPVNAAGEMTTTIRTSNLADGPIMIRSFLESVGTSYTPWTTGTAALKDTHAPDKPTILAPANAVTVSTSSTTVSGEAEANASISIWQEAQHLGSTTSNGSFNLTVPLQAGVNELTALATDSAGNQSRIASLPTITSTATNSAIVPAPEHLRTRTLSESRVQLTWTLDDAVLSQVHHFAVYTDDRTGTVNFLHPIALTTGREMTLTTTSLPKGTYRFVVRSVNEHGNQSTNADSATATVAGYQSDQALRGGQELLDFRPEQPVTLTTATDTTSRGRLSVESLGHANPVREALQGTVAVGNHYELLSTNDTVFPLEIRIYYTVADLAGSGVTNERQLSGLRFFDTNSRVWQSFEQTGVNTADTNVAGTNYAGFFYATTTHLTTVVGVADLTDPAIPAQLTGEAGNGRVKLTWQQQSEASGYWVRYRKATNIDTIGYTTTFLSGKEQTAHLISNLANGTLYEFGVATEDAAGNISDFAVIEQTPTAGPNTTDFITPATARLAVSSNGTMSQVTTADSSSQPGSSSGASQNDDSGLGTNDEPDENGDIKGGTDTKDETQSTRSLITLLIVLVAAAAGFGGYYGYQWWTARPEDFDEPEPVRSEEQPPKKAEKTEKVEKAERPGGRW